MHTTGLYKAMLHYIIKCGHIVCCVLRALCGAIFLTGIRIFCGVGRGKRRLTGMVLLEHMGDIVASEPILRSLRRRHPRDYLVWATQRSYGDLIRHHPELDRVLSVQCYTEWRILQRLGLFDDSYDLHFEGYHCPVCGIYFGKKMGDRSLNFKNYYDRGNLLRVFSDSAGLPVENVSPRIYIPEVVAAKVASWDIPAPYIVIHGRARQAQRGWQDGKWMLLAQRILQKNNYSVVEIGLEPVLSNQADPRILSYCARTSLLEMAEIIRESRLFVGVESGPAHLANAVGTFGVIITGKYFGFSDYLPYSGAYADGSNARILRHEGPAAETDLEVVWNAVSEKLI